MGTVTIDTEEYNDMRAKAKCYEELKDNKIIKGQYYYNPHRGIPKWDALVEFTFCEGYSNSEDFNRLLEEMKLYQDGYMNDKLESEYKSKLREIERKYNDFYSGFKGVLHIIGNVKPE